MDNYQIAVFDVGKTNKKLFIFDQDLKILALEKISIDESEENGIRHDNLQEIEKWFFSTLRKLTGLFRNIRSVSITTHGATFVCVGNDGKPSVPEISYTTDPGDSFHKEFFNEFGSRLTLQQETCTADFGVLINLAKGIWFVKRHYPAAFSKTKYILNFPQYFGYLLTGNAAAEPTYTGCHTYLWDFEKNDWSSVAERMGILSMLPSRTGNPWDILGSIKPDVARETGLEAGTLVTLGIHDSNASLLPYLITMENDFVLNSSGTWCVIMHQKDKVEFREDELGKVVFYNISAFSKPVKTAIFMGGLEFDHYLGIFRKLNMKEQLPSFNYEMYSEIIRKRELFILPSVTKGTGQFPESEPRIIEKGKIRFITDINAGKTIPEFFRDYETACAVLTLSLVIQTRISLERADMVDGLPLFVEGGFSANESYTSLLTASYPSSDVFITSLLEATAFGAAILGKASIEKVRPAGLRDFINIEKTKVPKVEMKGINEYVADYLKYI
jgi:L-fuculokinase